MKGGDRMSCPEATYRFQAIEDFAEKEDFDSRKLSALAYGVRIMSYRNFEPRDLRVVSGPWGLKFKLKRLLFGFHDNDTLFIREVVIPPNSNIELHYYDIVRQKEYVAEVVRRPGLNLDLRSGYHLGNRNTAYIICARDGGVSILDKDGRRRYVM